MALIATVSECPDAENLYVDRRTAALWTKDTLVVGEAVGVIANPARVLFPDAPNVTHRTTTGGAVHCHAPYCSKMFDQNSEKP